MIRFLKLLFGIPLLILAAIILLIAVVGFFADTTYSGRAVAAFIGIFTVALFIISRRLISTRRKSGAIPAMMYSGTEDAVNTFKFITASPDGTVSAHVNTAAEAKAAIKELRILKKSLSLQKRAVVDQQQAIRADYTDNVRSRGSKFRGGGGFGRFIRTIQTASRDSSRSQLARSLAPLESTKQRIEHAITQIDGLITKVEVMALRLN